MKARVAAVHKGIYEIRYDGKSYNAGLVGRLIYTETFPVVGDYVEVNIISDSEAIILNIYERKSYISRPNAGGHDDNYVGRMHEQPMVANVDAAFIITSLNQDFSVNRIARYASIARNGGVKPIVILSKADLVENSEVYVQQVRALSTDLTVFAVSSMRGEGLQAIRTYIQPGSTIALMGSSGAGKSTLINTLAGKTVMTTQAIRDADAKGRHTTTHRQLIEIDGVSYIDTPGMRGLAMSEVEQGIDETFADVADLISQCRFSDCSHANEKGCAVRQAITEGRLSDERWQAYLRLMNESKHNKGKKSNKMISIAKARRNLHERGRSNDQEE